MGGGTSTLSVDQSLLITKELKERYEKLKLEDIDDLSIQNILTAEYNKLAESFKDQKPTVPEQKKSVSKVSLSKKGGGLSDNVSSKTSGLAKNTSSKTPSRRKSFDAPKKTNIIQPSEGSSKVSSSLVVAINEQMVTSTSTPVMTPIKEVLDSWDSVSTQPFCTICQMAFKSPAFLERHVKYSDIHTRNVNLAAAAPSSELSDFALPFSGSTPSTKFTVKQVEGQHYKLLYTGSKLFWRTQETVDLNFYHHILPHTVEVISYDLMRSKEMSRLYFDYTAVLDIIAKSGCSVADDEAKRLAITTYMLQRLQLSSNSDKTGSLMLFVPLSGDDTSVKTPLLEKPPVVLIPVAVTRRRRTNAEEIDATISHLTNDRAALVAATGQAEKIANLVYSSASSIASKKWWADFSGPRKKWVWAIRRVIRQKLVAETKANLEMREKRAQSKSEKRRSYISKSKEV